MWITCAFVAKHIARECGILTEGGLAMEGPEFRALPDDELMALLPRLQASDQATGLTALNPDSVLRSPLAAV